jgi:hypothetical protein
MGFSILIYDATCEDCHLTVKSLEWESIPDFERRLESLGWSFAGDLRDRKTFCPFCEETEIVEQLPESSGEVDDIPQE